MNDPGHAAPVSKRALDRIGAGVLVVLVVGLLAQLAHGALVLAPSLDSDFRSVAEFDELLTTLRWIGAFTSVLVCVGYGIAVPALWRLSPLARAAAIALSIAAMTLGAHAVLLVLAPEWEAPVLVDLSLIWRWSNALAAPIGWMLVLAFLCRLGQRSRKLAALAAVTLAAHASISVALIARPELLLSWHEWSTGHTTALMTVLASLPLLAIAILLRPRSAAPTTVLADPPAWAEVGGGARFIAFGTAARVVVGLCAGSLALLATRRPLPALHDFTMAAQALAYAGIAAGCLRLRRAPDLGDVRRAVTAAAALFAGLALLDAGQLAVVPRYALGAGDPDAAPVLAALTTTTAAIAGFLLLASAARLAERLGDRELAARSRAVASGLAALAIGLLVLVPNLDASLRARGYGASDAEPWSLLLLSAAAVALGAVWALAAFARLFGDLADAIAARTAIGGAPAARAAVRKPD